MADNTTLNPGSSGDQIRDLARQSGVIKTQVVQLDLGGATANAEFLVTAIALADATANPTAMLVGAANLLYNGTTFDRQRGNFDTTAADTGAKTATFNGATQINYNARGAIIVINIGTVTGTAPTLTPQLQWSPDGGANWLTFGPAMTAITATGNYALVIYPTNLSQSAGATPTNLAVGANGTVTEINAPLSRTWRILYTIGGATPSFTIGAVWISYII